MTVQSMTGFARMETALPSGVSGGLAIWELKSVNGRALEMRFRLPSGLDRLEPDLRKALQARFKRGSIFVSLSISARQQGVGLNINAGLLADVLRLRGEIAAQMPLAPSTIEGLLSLRGMTGEQAGPDAASADDDAALLAGFEQALAALAVAREREGQTLAALISAQMDTVERLADAAAADPSLTVEAMVRRLGAQVALLMQGTAELDPQRLHAEAALLATKADITEEIARLRIHAKEVRALLGIETSGRKLDFLAQELNREANTLCSKANAASLTAIGLDLKVVIDQFREQTQNLE